MSQPKKSKKQRNVRFNVSWINGCTDGRWYNKYDVTWAQAVKIVSKLKPQMNTSIEISDELFEDRANIRLFAKQSNAK